MLFETFYPDTWVDSTYQIVEQSAGACADVQQRCAGALYRGCT